MPPEHPAPSFGLGDASFQAAGGEAGIRRLVDAFYDLMETLPEAAAIRAMHPEDLAVSRDKLTLFLCGWLGGPRLFREKYGEISIPGVHQHLAIDATARDAWLHCMRLAAERQPWAPGFREYLLRQLGIPAERVRQASEALRGAGASARER